jgi:hypothetical protein
MKKQDIEINQIWKSNYADISYRILGGGIPSHYIEMYNLENPWDCKNISKQEIRKHFTLQPSD